MDKLSILLDKDNAVFAPREMIRGTVRWDLDGNPARLDLSLFWYTAGKGSRDVGVVETQQIDSPGSSGSKDFSFSLPEGPYSFSGKLISLIWAIELTRPGGTEIERREFTLSPTGREIILNSTRGSMSPMGPIGPITGLQDSIVRGRGR